MWMLNSNNKNKVDIVLLCSYWSLLNKYKNICCIGKFDVNFVRQTKHV